MAKMERHGRAEPSEPLGTLPGICKGTEGLMISPMRAIDKISLGRELPCPFGHLLLCKFPEIKPAMLFKQGLVELLSPKRRLRKDS